MSTRNSDFEALQKRFGERIKDLRLKKGLSQTTLAQLSGLSLPSISKIERGEFNLTLADFLALGHSLQTQITLLFRGLE